MTNSLSKTQACLAVSCALALGLVPALSRAETINPAEANFVTDQRGAVAKSGFGLCWHSGYKPTPVSTAECDPNFVAPKLVKQDPPAAAVAPLIAGVKPAAERLTLDADMLFDFDRATLRPAGQTALDGFVDRLKDISPEMIMAVGHADRFGTADYNQRLSEERVGSVKTYLVGRGVDGSRVHTEGKGESQPITKAGDCVGAKSAKVIACLQPDRRVEIQMVGTRVAR